MEQLYEVLKSATRSLEDGLGIGCPYRDGAFPAFNPINAPANAPDGGNEMQATVELLRLHAEIYMENWGFFILIVIGVAGMLGTRSSGAPRVAGGARVFLTIALLFFFGFFYVVQLDNGCDILGVQAALKKLRD